MHSEKEIDAILKEFHSAVFGLIKICKKMEPNNGDIDRLHRAISLARDVEPLVVINTTKDKIWAYREEIISENIDFFLNVKISDVVDMNDRDQSIDVLINLIKNKLKHMSKAEMKKIWELSQTMLKCVVKYMKITA